MDAQRGPFWRVSWEGTTRYALKSEQKAWRQASTGPSSLVLVEEEAVAGSMLRLRLTGSLSGTWTIRLEPDEAGTRIRIEEESVATPGLTSWIRRFGRGNEAAEFLNDLAARLGEAAT